jgi:hypothetical protein
MTHLAFYFTKSEVKGKTKNRCKCLIIQPKTYLNYAFSRRIPELVSTSFRPACQTLLIRTLCFCLLKQHQPTTQTRGGMSWCMCKPPVLVGGEKMFESNHTAGNRSASEPSVGLHV